MTGRTKRVQGIVQAWICNGLRLTGMSPLREVVETIYCDDVVRQERLSCGHVKSTMTERDRPARQRRCHECAATS